MVLVILVLGTVDISYNTITGCSYPTATSGVFYGIWHNAATPQFTRISGNTISNDTTNATSGTYACIYTTGATLSGSVQIDSNVIDGIRSNSTSSMTWYGIWGTPAANGSTVSIRNNTFQNITFGNTISGTTGLIQWTGSLTAGTLNITGNNFNNLTLNTTGTTCLIWHNNATQNVNVTGNFITTQFTRSGSSGTFYCTYNFGSPSTGSALVANNNFQNITLAGSSTGYGIFHGTLVAQFLGIRNNIINNFSGGTGTTWGIFFNYGAAGSYADSNTVSNITGGGIVYGIQQGTNSTLSYRFNNNLIHSLTGTGTGAVFGMHFNPAAAGVNQVFNNRIYNLNSTNASGVVTGIAIVAGTTYTLYNNLIADVKATISSGTNQVIGLSSAIATGTINAWNNTIHLNTSSTGTNFGSSAISINTGATFNALNNIFINNSTPAGTGRTVAYRRSSTTLTTYGNTSNNNIWYAGDSTLSGRHIYNDGTNVDSLFSAYQTRVGTARDSLSATENITFLNTTGGANFLVPDSTITTAIEAGAVRIATVSQDANGRIRAGFNGYTGNSGIADIGAIEGNFTGLPARQMVFNNSNTAQNSSKVAIGTNDARILRISVNTALGLNALEATSFKLSTSGSTSATDIVAAKIYYTYADSTFTNPVLVGTTATPAGTFYVNGSIRVATGTSYFWLAYDISPSAVPGNVVDATLDSIVIGGINQAPIDGNPAGSRLIQGPLNGLYTVGASQTYPTIASALTELALLGVNAPVIFSLTDTVYSTTYGETFPLVLTNAPGMSATNTVSIVPTIANIARIEANSAVAVIDINNAANFIIDGSQGGAGNFVLGNNLSIVNTNTTAPAIRFINEASNNIVRYCEIRSNNSTATGAAGAGVVNFGTTTGANGNDNNLIRGCYIHEVTGGLPVIGVSSLGTLSPISAQNDNNTIDSCHIYNYGSASIASAGIYIGLNNNTWKINANRFYQTTPLSITTAGITHRALWVTPNTSSLTNASGFEIHNNYIGGNNASGTGFYTMTGAATYLFNGMDLSMGLGTPTSVQGNTVTQIDMTTASTSLVAFVGINFANGNINCGTTSPNIIGSTTTNGAINFTTTAALGGVTGIRANAGLTYIIRNNIISGINLNASTASIQTQFAGINVLGSTRFANVDSNTIGSNTLTNSINIVSTSASSTGASTMSGILMNISTGNVANNYTVNNNTIANINTNYAATGTQGTSLRGIFINTSVAGSYAVNNNLIYNLSSATQTTAGGSTGAIVGLCISNTAGIITSASNNTIYGLTLTGSSTSAAVNAAGIFFSTPTADEHLLSRNLVHSISLTTPNRNAIISGIDVAAGTTRIINNMIRLGIDQTGASITAAVTFRGITKNSNNSSIYFNSVYIGGTGVDTNLVRTFAFQRSGTGVDDVRNNLFINQRANATTGAAHVAVNLLNNTTLTMNNNMLRGDSIGIFNGVLQFSLSNWKSASGVDANSIASLPGFVNPTGTTATLNLRIDTSIATALEAYGSAVTGTGVDIDFDGQTRSALTPVDLGADAGNFIPSDIAGPVISYTALVNTISTADRTITATISDATGVYISGALQPRIYFKKFAAGSWNSAAGTLTSGTNTNGTWTFTISATTLGGLIADDSVYYFVIAQDSTGFNNIGSLPGGAEGTDVNTVTLFPNPFTYKVLPILSGNFNVGVGQPFTTLTGTNGMFSYLNAAVIGGNVTVTITSDIEEPGTNALNPMVETGAGNYTVTIVPDSAVVRSITGSIATANSAVIRINGADRVNIDGSHGGSGRYLRFMNRTNGAATINYLNDADFNTLANCIIEGVNNTVGTVNFFTAAVGGTGNDSNTVINCLFRDTLGSAMTVASGLNKPNTGIFSQGTAGAPNDNISVIGCEFDNFRFNIINLAPVGSGDFWTMYDNKIYHSNDSNFQNITWFQIQGGGGHLIRKNSIGGASANRSGTPQTLRGTGQQNLIFLNSTSTIPSTIDSNIIGNVITTSTISAFYGIRTSGPCTINANTIGGVTNPWDTLRLANVCYGILSGANGVIITNNTVANITGTSASAAVGGIWGSSGSYTIRNNTVRDISSPFNGTFTLASGPIGIYALPAAGEQDTIDANTVYNISATGAGLFAKGIQFGTSASNVLYCTRNRVYNITAPTNPNAAVAGIMYTLSGNNTIAHNQISLGMNTNERVFGIFNNGTTPGVLSVFHNTINITGVGDTTSFGVYNANTGSVTATNNLIYNNRSDTTLVPDPQFAIGAATVTPTSANLNYNLFAVNDTAAIAQLGVASQGWSAIGSLFTTIYNTNWAERTSVVLPNQLFTDASVANLSPIVSDPASWYLNGKAERIVGFNNGDFTAIRGVRSSTIAGGAVDIGSVEFTPTATPPSASQIGTIAAGDSTSYFVASRLVAKVKWGLLGTLPSALDVKYYSGTNPPNTFVGATFMNAYWDIQPTGGSAYDYNLTLMQDSAVLGTVGSLNNLSIARYEGFASNWSRPATVVNNVTGFMTADAANTMGIFTGTDTTNNPLPVVLTRFTATAQQQDVVLNWNTASELNNQGFDVERSADGQRFEAIQFVKGNGNSNIPKAYQTIDRNAFATQTVWFYRLRQVDMDGRFSYSNKVRVSKNNQQAQLTVYPNPFETVFTISVEASNNDIALIELVDVQGKVVSTWNKRLTQGINQVELETESTLPSGLYIARIVVNGLSQQVKISKQ
ncbi:MAG: T9SS type A sorting domain-containing protein [Bacteroidia bacterium]|jgi:hypothetical protein|nr:T9SS type A sorting domain-containing protein [Bacteroidia bacterium]